MRRLDSVFGEICEPGDVVLLEIDTQGFEKHVIDGATRCLDRIAGMRLALSYQSHCDGERCFDAMIAHMREPGFQLVMLEPLGIAAEPPRILQSDGTFLQVGR